MIEFGIIGIINGFLLFRIYDGILAAQKRLDIAEEMINDLANQYMILLHVRRQGNVIELRPEAALKETEH
jgi:hypothetical protein